MHVNQVSLKRWESKKENKGKDSWSKSKTRKQEGRMDKWDTNLSTFLTKKGPDHNSRFEKCFNQGPDHNSRMGKVAEKKVALGKNRSSSCTISVTTKFFIIESSSKMLKCWSKKALRPNGATKDSLTLGNKRPSGGPETSRRDGQVLKQVEETETTV